MLETEHSVSSLSRFALDFRRSSTDTIMAQSPKLDNELRVLRLDAGWSQAELGRRSGLSRAEISAIETGRLVPSTATALALADALGMTVESLFRLPSGPGLSEPATPGRGRRRAASGRYWRAEVGGRGRLYPVEVSGARAASSRRDVPRSSDLTLIPAMNRFARWFSRPATRLSGSCMRNWRARPESG